MLQKFIVVSLLSVWSLQTVAKDLAITFDDSPRFAWLLQWQTEITKVDRTIV